MLLLATPGRTHVAFAASPSIGGCPVLPANDIWNTPIDTLPVDANSSRYISTIGATLGLKADFGSGTWDGGPIGIPFITVRGSQTKYPVDFDYDDESDEGPYAVPLNAPIEGGPNADGDRHAIAIDTDNCILYELYSAYPGTNRWDAGSGAIYDLRSSELRPDSWTSADAAGLPIFPGLVRYDEIAAGEINHAIRFTVPRTRNTYVWPARHEASDLTGTQYPPMGQRFRLKANFDISGFSPANQVILRALKKYGLILADNGSSWYMSGAPDSRWDNDDLHELDDILGSNFEAVDVSSLMIDPDSGQAGPAAPDSYDVAWGAHNTPAAMQTGVTSTVKVSLTNTSDFSWANSGAYPVNVTYHWRRGACPSDGGGVWSGIRTALPANIPPQGTVSDLPVTVQAPLTAGTYCLQYDLARERIAWFSQQGAPMLTTTVVVTAPKYGVLWGPAVIPASMPKDATQQFTATFSNTGWTTWNNTGANVVNFTYHWRKGACPTNGGGVWSGVRTHLPANVPPGDTVSNLKVTVTAPSTAGTYCIQFDMAKEGVAWFSREGQPMLERTVTITN